MAVRLPARCLLPSVVSKRRPGSWKRISVLTSLPSVNVENGQVRVRGGTLDQVAFMVDGARAFLEAVAARYPTALATSAVRRNQELAFERFDLMPFFEAVVVAEDLTHHKPHPEPYLTAAAGLAQPPERCLVLEDSVNGIRSARAAGCTAVGITTSFSAEALREAGAHHVADSFAALAALFGSQPRRR